MTTTMMMMSISICFAARQPDHDAGRTCDVLREVKTRKTNRHEEENDMNLLNQKQLTDWNEADKTNQEAEIGIAKNKTFQHTTFE